jgi:hypothetical protein
MNQTGEKLLLTATVVDIKIVHGKEGDDAVVAEVGNMNAAEAEIIGIGIAAGSGVVVEIVRIKVRTRDEVQRDLSEAGTESAMTAVTVIDVGRRAENVEAVHPPKREVDIPNHADHVREISATKYMLIIVVIIVARISFLWRVLKALF